MEIRLNEKTLHYSVEAYGKTWTWAASFAP